MWFLLLSLRDHHLLLCSAWKNTRNGAVMVLASTNWLTQVSNQFWPYILLISEWWILCIKSKKSMDGTYTTVSYIYFNFAGGATWERRALNTWEQVSVMCNHQPPVWTTCIYGPTWAQAIRCCQGISILDSHWTSHNRDGGFNGSTSQRSR